MDAEIHSVDTDKRESEDKRLYVRLATIELELKRSTGDLPLGDHKDQHFIELTASSLEGATRSTLTAHLYADDLERLYKFAVETKMIG